jgi:hypothetical protein
LGGLFLTYIGIAVNYGDSAEDTGADSGHPGFTEFNLSISSASRVMPAALIFSSR